MNEFIYRQIEHIATTYIKDKFVVVAEVAKMLFKSSDKSSRVPQSSGRDSSKTKRSGKVCGLPDWYRPKYRAGVRMIRNVVDLDGPLQTLAPYLGKSKGTIRKWQRQGIYGKNKIKNHLERRDAKGI